MSDRRSERVAALAAALRAAHLDGLLITSLPNIRYLTGFSGSSAIVVVSERDLLLVTDFRYATQVKEEVGDPARVAIEAQSLWTGVWRQMADMTGLEVVGFESAYLVHRDFERLLNAGARWQWRATTDLVETLREQKDAGEIESITSAARVAERALERTLAGVRAGQTELEIAGALELALRDAGSTGFPFETIVASGERSALPHARAGSRQVRAGDFLLIDFGAIVDGYCSDITRTVIVGRATPEQRDVHDIVRTANERASDLVRAGMTGKDADALARRYIEERGLGEAFGHSLGHGIGIEVHEAPRLARTTEAVLPERAVVTIEPGVYRAGWGGVRVEDDVVLRRDSATILTTFSRELLEVG